MLQTHLSILFFSAPHHQSTSITMPVTAAFLPVYDVDTFSRKRILAPEWFWLL